MTAFLVPTGSDSRAFAGQEWCHLCISHWRDPTRDMTELVIDIVIDCILVAASEPWPDKWTQLDIAFRIISVPMQRCRMVFGFSGREEMVFFSEAILAKKMPTVFSQEAVLYQVKGGDGKWYEASLISEELIGETRIFHVST